MARKPERNHEAYNRNHEAYKQQFHIKRKRRSWERV